MLYSVEYSAVILQEYTFDLIYFRGGLQQQFQLHLPKKNFNNIMNAVKIFSTLVLIAILSACGSDRGTLAIDWVTPSQRDDGTPLILSEIETYNLYYGSSPGDYQDTIDNSNVTTDSVYISDFPGGTYYFVITTVTYDGLESRYSEEIEIII